MQTFLAFDGDKEIERSNAMKQFVEKTNARYAGCKNAKQIPAIPEKLDRKMFQTMCSAYEKKCIPVGLDFESIDPVGIRLEEDLEIAFVAKKKERASAFIKILIKTMLLQAQADFYLVDNFGRELAQYSDMPQIQRYTIDVTESEMIFEAVVNQLKLRKSMLMAGQPIDGEHTIVIVLNSKDALEYISATKPVLALYNEIIKTYKNYGVFIVYGDIEDEAIAYGGPELLKHIKDTKKAFVFDNASAIKLFDVNTQFARKHAKALEKDECYWFNGTDLKKVKLITED
jgi:S-DNA-T family DNA segregation ATPase FtsK/SpoIIIE